MYSGLAAYACDHWVRHSFHWDAPQPRALIVGAGSGIFGAVPLGFLVSNTGLGLSLALSILVSAIYVFVMFAGYVLLWERRARRRNDADQASPDPLAPGDAPHEPIDTTEPAGFPTHFDRTENLMESASRDERNSSPYWPRSLFLSLALAGYASVGSPFLVWYLIELVLVPDSREAVGLMLFMYIIPNAFLGLFTGVAAYSTDRWSRRRYRRFPRALFVGSGSGVIGAAPLGLLVSSTARGLALTPAILGSAIYVFVVFTGYVLLWERRAPRRHGSDG